MIWAANFDIPSDRLPALFEITHLHFACNTAFRRTSRGQFEVHVTSLPPVYPRDFDVTAH